MLYKPNQASVTRRNPAFVKISERKNHPVQDIQENKINAASKVPPLRPSSNNTRSVPSHCAQTVKALNPSCEGQQLGHNNMHHQCITSLSLQHPTVVLYAVKSCAVTYYGETFNNGTGRTRIHSINMIVGIHMKSTTPFTNYLLRATPHIKQTSPLTHARTTPPYTEKAVRPTPTVTRQ